MAIVARGQEELSATAEELAAETGQRVVPIVTDVTSREQVDRMTHQAAEQLGGLHVLVNSGAPPGGSPTAVGRIDTVVDEDLLQDFNVKYVGALRCCRAALPHMQAAGWGAHHQHQRHQRPPRPAISAAAPRKHLPGAT